MAFTSQKCLCLESSLIFSADWMIDVVLAVCAGEAVVHQRGRRRGAGRGGAGAAGCRARRLSAGRRRATATAASVAPFASCTGALINIPFLSK